MKITCQQSELNACLSLVSRAVASRPSHPVLANVLLDADSESNTAQLTGFDLSLGISVSLACEVEDGGKITLPARLLGDIVSRLPEGELTLECTDEFGATITSASGKYQLQGMTAEEFPALPTIDDGESLELDSEALLTGIRNTLFAASSDETKQVLTGLCLTISAADKKAKTPAYIEFGCTNGHVLATLTQETECDRAESIQLVIPSKALAELTKLLEKQKGTVNVKCDRSQIVFSVPGQRLTSRLLEGQYPNYRQLIPKDFVRLVTCNRRELVARLERIAVLADQKNNIVKLEFSASEQEVVISVEAADVGSGREVMPVVFSGEDLAIAFNVRYLLDGLKVMSTPEVQMQFNTATSPAVFSPVDGLKMTYLAMPVQVKN